MLTKITEGNNDEEPFSINYKQMDVQVIHSMVYLCRYNDYRWSSILLLSLLNSIEYSLN